jgi:hypothetical protein
VNTRTTQLSTGFGEVLEKTTIARRSAKMVGQKTTTAAAADREQGKDDEASGPHADSMRPANAGSFVRFRS